MRYPSFALIDPSKSLNPHGLGFFIYQIGIQAIYSFFKSLCGTLLDAGNIAVSQTNKVLSLMALTFCEGTDAIVNKGNDSL